ncbi:MAG: GDYXXLXY domain-containing protein [Porphyrobacter sp.]|nr:GDYXXLXY domain-containing protein [Porphyrobacter sp.]
MIRAARLLAALLPLAGLAALWVQSDRTYNSGTEWEVPIMGYDPRDYLRGHYVEFAYDWPGGEELGDIYFEALCLDGQAPRVDRVRWLTNDSEACAHPMRSDLGGVYGSDGLFRGRLYLGQERAAQLEQQLRNRDQRGIVTIRQREDGSFTPIGIRFRPLTPAEKAERDAPPSEPLDPLAPPAVLEQ